jgi:hypothetical protein
MRSYKVAHVTEQGVDLIRAASEVLAFFEVKLIDSIAPFYGWTGRNSIL